MVVGGGILGTMHALFARRLGIEVIHLERDLEPRSATVRNFGLVWVSGRKEGEELAAALRARALWEEIGHEVAGVGFRPDGSLTLVTHPAEVAVLEQVVARQDAAMRGVHLLDPDQTRKVNPLLRGTFLAALHCTVDAVVEPRHSLPALRESLKGDGYTWLPGATVTGVETGRVTDQRGAVHEGDHILLCPGATPDGAMAALLDGEPVRRVQIQMMQTAPLGQRLTTSLADGDSLRYYPGFDVPALADLPPPAPLVDRLHMQLLVSQRASGELTIGDTHAYDEPFDFATDDGAYAHLQQRLESFLGAPLPPVRRRWSGIYAEALDKGICHRREVLPGVTLVTGPGGRGMTLAPAIAERSWQLLGGVAA